MLCTYAIKLTVAPRDAGPDRVVADPNHVDRIAHGSRRAAE